MTPLQNALRILALVVALFLIFLLIWLFYCRCYRRGAVEPGGPTGQPLNHATAEPHRAEGGKYPAFTTPPDGDRNNEFPYAVPAGPVRGTLGPTVSASQLFKLEKKKEDIPPQGGAGDPVVFTDYDPLGTTSNFSGTPPDMNAARSGNVAILSYNSRVQLTTDGAVTWTERDPTTIFPSGPATDAAGNQLDKGFCCDQIIQYVPKIDRVIWLMQFCGTGANCLQGINKIRIASASPQEIINSNATAWTYWDLASATFSLGNTTMDYPDLSVGDNFLYMSSDAVSSGLFVVRIPLTEIQNSQTIHMDFTDPADGQVPRGGHISQNTGNEVFWAGHNSSSQMRVYSMREGDGQYFWRDININSWNRGILTSNAPGPIDWLSFDFPRNAVLGITRRNSNEVWFAWSAMPGNGFTNTHVQVVEMNITNYSVISQWAIWNNDYAFAYPSLSTNENNEVGISLAWGGNQNYGNHAVGILGDFIVWYPELSDAAISRWGDYVSVRRNSPNGRLYDASGYAVFKNTAPATGTRFDPYYIQFGRDSVVNGGSPVK